MVKTEVGYCGGSTDHPTYERLTDHTEALRVTFDPSVLSYDDLLGVFFAEHRPVRPSWSRQYRSALFYEDGAQRAVAQRRLEAQAEAWGTEIFTDLEPLTTFWRAEDYHQKWSLRRLKDVVAALDAQYPDEGWVDSTVGARLNAYAAGHGRREELLAELSLLGVPAPALADFGSALSACGR